MSSSHEEARKDQYEVLGVIGQGSFGKVCKIKRKSDGKILVWKEMNYGQMSSKEKELVVGEVNILRDLKNPFIVKYYDRIVDREATKLYIVMELCTGGDLGKVVKKCKQDKTSLDEAVIWKVIAQAVVALKDCHRRKENGELKPILHRDIKTANFLLDGNHNIKIGDFGLAKELGNAKMAKTNVGTPYYMSPELINEKNYNEKTDIWSLGCLVYELASLRPPFEAANQVALAMKINQGRYPRIPLKYSDSLFELIKSMLHLDPRRRPAVEDFERNRTLGPYLREANFTLREFNLSADSAKKTLANQHAIESKMKDISRREAELSQKEKDVAEREKALTRREYDVGIREREVRHQEQRLASSAAAAAAAAKATAVPMEVVSAVGPTPRSVDESKHSSAGAFSIYSDMPPPPPPTTATSADGVKTRQQEFLKNQHRLYLKQQDQNQRGDGEVGVGSKRPPPPVPTMTEKRAPLNINIPNRASIGTGLTKGARSSSSAVDKENIIASAAAAPGTTGPSEVAAVAVTSRDQNKRQRMEPIKSSTFLAELSRKNVPLVRRIN